MVPGGSDTPGGVSPGGSGTPDPMGAPLPPPPPAADAPVTGPLASVPGPSSRLVRLSHRQWENTVRDLFRLSEGPGLSQEFLSEPIRSSFDNNGGLLEVGNQLWQDYQKAAEALAAQAAKNQQLWAGYLEGAPATSASARIFLRNFGLRAFRRPLTEAELDGMTALFGQAATILGGSNPFADGVELTVSAFLQSPFFLYRTELGTEVVDGRIVLTDFEVASRLSYGLVASMPDEMLLGAAGAGQLTTRDGVRAHAARLLDGTAGKATLEDFHSQLLALDHYPDVKRDTDRHPLFKTGMGGAMKQETLSFIADVVFGQDQGVTELLTAPYTFANADLAAVYGVPGAPADRFVRVDLDPAQRAGLLTQLGFLAVNATDAQPRSIMRGVHVSLDILCAELPAPPNVPPETPSDVGKTNRQLLEAYTEAPGSVCQPCHAALINPLGFAFENYDSLGKYRTSDNGQPIDASGVYQLSEGESRFQNAVELMKVLGESKQAHECYARHLFEYVYGRELASAGDKALIAELGRRSRGAVSVRNVVLDLVSTDAFLTRLP